MPKFEKGKPKTGRAAEGHVDEFVAPPATKSGVNSSLKGRAGRKRDGSLGSAGAAEGGDEAIIDLENFSTPERTGADASADAMAGDIVTNLRPEEVIQELGAMVGFGPPIDLANPGLGHHTAAQCPYLGCRGPHAVGPYRTDCPRCGKTKTIAYGVACSACGYL